MGGMPVLIVPNQNGKRVKGRGMLTCQNSLEVERNVRGSGWVVRMLMQYKYLLQLDLLYL